MISSALESKSSGLNPWQRAWSISEKNPIISLIVQVSGLNWKQYLRLMIAFFALPIGSVIGLDFCAKSSLSSSLILFLLISFAETIVYLQRAILCCGGGGNRTHGRLFRPSEVSNLLQCHYATPPSLKLRRGNPPNLALYGAQITIQ